MCCITFGGLLFRYPAQKQRMALAPVLLLRIAPWPAVITKWFWWIISRIGFIGMFTCKFFGRGSKSFPNLHWLLCKELGLDEGLASFAHMTLGLNMRADVQKPLDGFLDFAGEWLVNDVWSRVMSNGWVWSMMVNIRAKTDRPKVLVKWTRASYP